VSCLADFIRPILLCALVSGCAAAGPDRKPGQDPAMRDASDNAELWIRDQCMDGKKEACDELRRSRAAKR
jgi:hypothetical protein